MSKTNFTGRQNWTTPKSDASTVYFITMNINQQNNQSVFRAANVLNIKNEISLDFRQYASIKYVLNRIDILINVTTGKSFFAYVRYVLQQVFTGINKELRALTFYSSKILSVRKICIYVNKLHHFWIKWTPPCVVCESCRC